MKREKSEGLHKAAMKVIPGGVHSPVRSFKGLFDTPVFISKAKGAYLDDTDGNNYIDFCLSFGPLLFGHAPDFLTETIIEAAKDGTSYGAAEPYSLAMAEFLTTNLPFIEQVRFVSSGTEATMTALRLARGATKRNKIVKFSGAYHGHADFLLLKAGSGLAMQAESSSAGVPESFAQDTIILNLDDSKGLEECFQKFGQEIAAAIIEPLPANNGLLPQRREFLELLAKLCQNNKTLLIFDEVISGFRIAFGGMAEKLDIKPDLVTYGKIIGAGMPVGAIAGPREIMEHLAPEGDVYQAGTLSANPLCMRVGLKALEKIKEFGPNLYLELEKQTSKCVKIWRNFLDQYQDGKFSHYGIRQYASLYWFYPYAHDLAEDEFPRSPEQFKSDILTPFKEFHHLLLDKGIYLSPNPYEVNFLSHAHSDDVLTDLEKRLWS